MKKHLSTLLLILVFVVGLSLMLYPAVSDAWNSRHQSQAIASYDSSVSAMSQVSYDQAWAEARAYNETLLNKENRYFLSDEESAKYESLLDVTGTGVMGYIEIPALNCSLPVYHGTDEAVLQVAIGHIAGTSLPVGGIGTHSVLSGHRGLPSAKLFSNLNEMAEGDVFLLHILDEVLTYEVDQILTVLPEEIAALEIDPEADLCTLVTCTPYGVNTHRLLVRGHRVETEEARAAVRVENEAARMAMWQVAPFAAAPVLVLAALVRGICRKNRRNST